tara:strand:- start:1813 stop:2064 length:252 start_codon:yes stop_codon:yes gene_type:complete
MLMTEIIRPPDFDPIDAEVDLEVRKQFPLSYTDRQRLRKIVKKVHLKHLPKSHLTDKEADKMIEALGPATREKLIVMYIENVK